MFSPANSFEHRAQCRFVPLGVAFHALEKLKKGVGVGGGGEGQWEREGVDRALDARHPARGGRETELASESVGREHKDIFRLPHLTQGRQVYRIVGVLTLLSHVM